MIRAEIKTPHKAFVFCEETLADAQEYTAAMVANGVTVLKAEYFDRETRVADIRAGLV